MKYVVMVTVEGLEQIAKGGVPYAWQLQVAPAEGFKVENYTERTEVGRFTAKFPSAADCITPVLEKLKAKEQEIQAEAYAEMMKVKERREQLLALPMAPQPPAADVSPFEQGYLDTYWRERAECICTGCSLEFEGKYWWGDLWQGPHYYLFNATTEAALPSPVNSLRVISLDTAPNHTGKVLTINKDTAVLSPELKEYING